MYGQSRRARCRAAEETQKHGKWNTIRGKTKEGPREEGSRRFSAREMRLMKGDARRRDVTSRAELRGGKVTSRNRRYAIRKIGYKRGTEENIKGGLTTWSQRSGRVSDHKCALARSRSRRSRRQRVLFSLPPSTENRFLAGSVAASARLSAPDIRETAHRVRARARKDAVSFWSPRLLCGTSTRRLRDRW